MGYETFKNLCDENKMTVNMVSKATGIDSATLSAWKLGKYTPKADKRQVLADYFGVSLEYLDTGDESLRDYEKEFSKETDPDMKEAYRIMKKATPKERAAIVRMIKALTEQ